MKIAVITHKNPYLTGGGEKMARALVKVLNADVIGFENTRWKDTSYLKSCYKMSRLDTSEYDLTIGIDDIAARANPNILYFNTPRRAFYV